MGCGSLFILQRNSQLGMYRLALQLQKQPPGPTETKCALVGGDFLSLSLPPPPRFIPIISERDSLCPGGASMKNACEDPEKGRMLKRGDRSICSERRTAVPLPRHSLRARDPPSRGWTVGEGRGAAPPTSWKPRALQGTGAVARQVDPRNDTRGRSCRSGVGGGPQCTL